MNCPYCNVPIRGRTPTVCPKCWYDLSKKDGGQKHIEWMEEHDPIIVAKREEEKRKVREEIERKAKEAAERKAREEAEAKQQAIDAIIELAAAMEAAYRERCENEAIDHNLPGYYEYQVISLRDENGNKDYENLCTELTVLSAQGWHVVAPETANIVDAEGASRLYLDTKRYLDDNTLLFERFVPVTQ